MVERKIYVCITSINRYNITTNRELYNLLNMPKIVARTSIKPNYTDHLYYCKGSSVYSYNKRTKSKKALENNVFSRKEGHGYVLKRTSGGNLVVVERSLASMRAKGRKKRSANAKKRQAKRRMQKLKKRLTRKKKSAAKKKKKTKKSIKSRR